MPEQSAPALHLYALDHEDRFPFPNNSAFGESGQHFDLCWFNALDKSLSSATTIATAKAQERALYIKQDPVFKKFVPSWKTNAHTLKMNENLGRFDQEGSETRSCFWSPNDCSQPARTVLVFDGRAEGEVLADGSPNIIAQRSDGTEGYAARRHQDGSNVLFVDGHVEHRREKQQTSGTQKGWEVNETSLIWKPWEF
jgi:prepilin-type processing-associated H-X9-DG protein